MNTDDEGGEKLQKLAGPALGVCYAVLTGDLIGGVGAVGKGIAAFFTAHNTRQVFDDEFAEMVCLELTTRVTRTEERIDSAEQRGIRNEWRVDELEAKLTQVLTQLAAKPNLTATETAAVLSVVRRVWERSFDPTKRRLIGAALRSCLLDREKYEAGLRRSFLEILDALEFGDIVLLAAVANRADDELVKAAGLIVRHGTELDIGGPESVAGWHAEHLVKQGLMSVGSSSGFPHLNKIVHQFLAFIDATPESLLAEIKSEHAAERG